MKTYSDVIREGYNRIQTLRSRAKVCCNNSPPLISEMGIIGLPLSCVTSSLSLDGEYNYLNSKGYLVKGSIILCPYCKKYVAHMNMSESIRHWNSI